MELQIDSLIRTGHIDVAEDALQQYMSRRLSLALRRFQNAVRHVTVRMTDENGPRGGVDTRCAITADLTDGRRIFVEATAAWPFAAASQAAARLNEALRRHIARHAARRRSERMRLTS